MDKIKNEDIPPSLLLAYLRDGRVSGYLPVKLGNQTTEMFWTLGGKVTDIEEMNSNYSERMSLILGEMNSVNHPLTPQAISEKITEKGYEMGSFTVNLLLNEIEKTSRVRKSGDSWEYTIQGRLLDLFMSHPDEMFDLDDLFKKISLGKIHEGKLITPRVLRYLRDFQNAHVILQIKDKWTLMKNIDEKIESVTERKIQNKKEEKPNKIDRYW